MSDRQAFMKAIIADPEDDTPRLVFADWLDDNGGRDSDRDLAEFVRTQCGRRHPDPHYPGSWYSYHQHRVIDKRLGWAADVNRMLRLMGAGMTDQKNFGCYEWNEDESTNSIYMKIEDTKFVLRRGFVEHVICTSGAWVTYADQIAWRPGRLAVCPNCAGKGWHHSAKGLVVDCKPCGGGRVGDLLPFPEHAWPIKKVSFTSWPTGIEFGYNDVRSRGDTADRHNRTSNLIPFKERWDWIEFEFTEERGADRHSKISGYVSPLMCDDGKGGRVPRHA